MGIFFSKKKKEKDDSLNDKEKAVLELERQKTRLQKYQKHINDNVLPREIKLARQLMAAKQKARAILVLKKKKYQESILDKVELQLANLSQMIQTIRFAEISAKTFEALREGSTQLNLINEEMKMEDVEKLMEDTAEAVAMQEQMSEALSGQLSPQDEVDVENALKAMEQEIVDEQVQEMPTAPVGKNIQQKKEEKKIPVSPPAQKEKQQNVDDELAEMEEDNRNLVLT